jgi:pimeloyl-ACP methyl ester carboxylesterase
MTGAGAVARWWDALPADFYRQPDGTPIDTQHPLKIRSTAALDHFARLYLGVMLACGLAPRALKPGWARAERARMAFYRPYADRANVDEIFVPPPERVPVMERAPARGEWRPRGLPCRVLSFESPFEPLNPELRPAWAVQPRNRIVRAQYWTHRNGPRPTLIFVHGYYASPYWLNSRMFALPWMFRQGYDILLFTLPFHGKRARAADPFSGYGFVANGVAGVNEAMLQSVLELRIVVSELLRRGAPAVGISGLSLGGYLSALLACVEERLAFCIPNSPLVAPTDMALEWLSLRWLLRLSMRLQGVDVHDMRHELALHSPLSFQPRIPGNRLLIIGGAGDRFTPPRYVRLLHEHWKGSHLHWYPGNHLIHLQRGGYLKLMKWFMDRHSFPSASRWNTAASAAVPP